MNVNGEMVHSGNYSVEGSEQGDESEGEPPVKFWQDLSLAPYQIWINAGLGIANIEGWLRNGNSESYRFKVTFYNSLGNSLDAYDTGWVHNASGDYFHHANVRSIPVGTAYVRVEGQMKRNAGSYTDVNIDDLTFIIQFNNP